MNYPVENIIIDGESDCEGTMCGMDKGEEGFHPPFALFSPDLQVNVGGPYASYDHAEAALELIKKGVMVPYTNRANVIWTINGKPKRNK